MNDLDRQIKLLTKKLNTIKSVEVPRAASKALNDTERASRVRAIRGISATTKIKQKLIKKRLFTTKSTPRTMFALIRAYMEGISAISTMTNAQVQSRLAGSGRRRRGGVKTAGRKFASAFVADGSKLKHGSGKGRTNKGVLKNTAHVLKRTSGGRYPLEVVKIQIKDAVTSIVPKTTAREMRKNYAKRLRHELKFRLGKYKA